MFLIRTFMPKFSQQKDNAPHYRKLFLPFLSSKNHLKIENVQIVSHLLRNQMDAITWHVKNVGINSVGFVWKNIVNIITGTTIVLDVLECCLKVRIRLYPRDSNNVDCICLYLSFWLFFFFVTLLSCQLTC